MYMVLVKNNGRTQNPGHTAVATKGMDGKPGHRCRMSQCLRRNGHIVCKSFLYYHFMTLPMHGDQNKQEREREKIIKMKFLFSSVGKQSMISSWINNCVSLVQVMF